MTVPPLDLRSELTLTPGPVPATVAGAIVDCDGFVASRDAFVLTIDDDLRFHYRRGRGVRYFASPQMNAAAVSSFHNGSVYGAAAWMNGYLPLHASAVISGGVVHAFAGASGEGKSTLASALGQRGLDLFADDVVTLDTSGASALALPGHKQLKLWADALTITGMTGQDRVWPDVDKYFVCHEPSPDSAALPLCSLTILESSPDDEICITRLEGAERFLAFSNNCYRPEYRLPTCTQSAFAQLAIVAQAVPVYRFCRPRDLRRFGEGVDRIMTHVEGMGR